MFTDVRHPVQIKKPSQFCKILALCDSGGHCAAGAVDDDWDGSINVLRSKRLRLVFMSVKGNDRGVEIDLWILGGDKSFTLEARSSSIAGDERQ